MHSPANSLPVPPSHFLFSLLTVSCWHGSLWQVFCLSLQGRNDPGWGMQVPCAIFLLPTSLTHTWSPPWIHQHWGQHWYFKINSKNKSSRPCWRRGNSLIPKPGLNTTLAESLDLKNHLITIAEIPGNGRHHQFLVKTNWDSNSKLELQKDFTECLCS